MKVKKYDEFVNEEISRKGLLGAMGGAILGVGAIGAGIANYRDKQIEPTETTTSTKKEIPNQFEIDEKLLNIGNDFYITNSKRENFGKIEQRFLSFGKKFEYFDSTGKLDAVAQEEAMSFKSIVNVKDSNGVLIGTIEEEVLESLGNMLEGQNVYSILDAQGNVLGKSKSDIIIKNNIDIYDNNDNLIVTFHTPALSFGERWKSEIKDNKIDKRLLIFIPAYISSKSSSSKSSSSK
jgi:uncharacterized protein YxjI